MSTILKLRRGSTSQHATFTGQQAEVTVDTTKKVIVVHDGSTAGGNPMASEKNVAAGVGVAMLMIGERNSIGAIGQMLSHGNDLATGKGIKMPMAGKISKMTLAGFTITGTITVQIAVNGTPNSNYRATVTGTASDNSIIVDFSSNPLTFNAGDLIGFYIAAAATTANGFTATAIVTFS